MPELIYCKGCGKGIKMIPLAGKSTVMPVDAWPVRCVPDGTSRLLLVNEDGTTFLGREVDKSCTGAALAYKPHWISCPNPVARKRKAPAPPQQKERPLSGNAELLAAAREFDAQRRAKEAAEKEVKRLIEEREREWKERQTSLF